MKLLIFLLALSLSLPLIANSSLEANPTEEEALKLWNLRGDDFNNAYKSALIYQSLATQERDEFKKAIYLTKESEARYFWADLTPSNSDKIERHQKGYEVALDAVALLASAPGVPKKEEYKTPLSRAYYFYGANLGKWAQARGIFASLGRWFELRDNMEHVMKLDKTVEDYGATRVLGRGYQKVPSIYYGGSETKALEYLTLGHNSTLTTLTYNGQELTLSRNSTTVLYYLDILQINEETDEFCKIYEAFDTINNAPLEVKRAYNPDKLPETIKDLDEFNNKDDWEDVRNYYDEEC